MDEINQKIETLRKQYPTEEDQAHLTDVEIRAKKAVITAGLQNHDAIKLIIEQYQKELLNLNKLLMEEQSLFKDDSGRILGQLIHTRKKWCRDFLKIFTTAEQQVKGADRYLGTLMDK